MHNKLFTLINENKSRLLELNISIDEMKSSELEFKERAEQVDLFNESSFARITLFESNRLYIHILNTENEETIYFYDEVLDKDVNVDEFIMNSIYKMIS
ncbi:MAG: hypothetical protein OSJ60_21945 [Lachnospiraceae bacterium]|nr:hypothetical protein [Lachnospiraceae bacterium]